MSISEEEDIYPSLSADEGSFEEQERSSESNDDIESEDEEWVYTFRWWKLGWICHRAADQRRRRDGWNA